MGGDSFTEKVKGCDTAEEAFNAAVTAAKYEYGNRGYTGSIAEKETFVMFDYNPGPMTDNDFADWLLHNKEELHPYDSPAGCFENDNGAFHFFGVARS